MWSKTKRNREQKSEKKESEKKRCQTKQRAAEKEGEGGAGRRRRSSSWKRLNYILGIAALSVFQFVIVCLRRHRTKYWTEILQYDLLRECERASKRDSCVCTAASSCQKFQRKWIRLWHSILYFGYPLLWQTQQSAAMICQRKVFVTVLCGACWEREKGEVYSVGIA